MNKLIKKFTILALMLVFSATAKAQNVSVPDTLSGWAQSWVANMNGSQAAYSNWSQGGVSTLSGTASSVYTLMFRKGLYSYGFRTNLKYGQSKVKDDGVRKTDDLISITNRFNYLFRKDGTLSSYATIIFRTQFDRGFEYGEIDSDPDILISNFMAPGYLSESVGLSYKPAPAIIFEAGLGLKQTFVTEDALAPQYGLDPGDNFRSEGGLTTGIYYEKEVFENILYTSGLETFTNFLIPIDETDVMWGNELVGKINSLISASFQFELRYDNDFSSEIQLKQVLSAGISVSLY
ncbi:MAG: DUF3078 domain-containing protein [Gracilimonas sp.]|nr:DUF3078 domain-containing protein [Gracilimonas sp.]